MNINKRSISAVCGDCSNINLIDSVWWTKSIGLHVPYTARNPGISCQRSEPIHERSEPIHDISIQSTDRKSTTRKRPRQLKKSRSIFIIVWQDWVILNEIIIVKRVGLDTNVCVWLLMLFNFTDMLSIINTCNMLTKTDCRTPASLSKPPIIIFFFFFRLFVSELSLL